MGLIGAILGDIIGSKWEFNWPRNIDWKHVELFDPINCFITDDTVLSVATAYAIENNVSFTEAYRKFSRQYPDSGFGGMYYQWMRSDDMEPYNSFGNGSAMRVSYIADKFDTKEEVIEWATKSANATHNHPEGVKGAVVTAVCSFMSRKGATKEEIYEYAKSQYGDIHEYEFTVDTSLEELRKWYYWSETCQNSVPVAIRCFLDSRDYESFIRNVLSFKCDTDTIAAIGGCIAENYYGTTGFDNGRILREYLDPDLYDLVMKYKIYIS